MFNTLTYQPIYNGLIFLYEALGNDLGIAIIAITLIIRFILLPLTLPAMRSAQQIKELKPKLDDLKEKHKGDKTALQQAQLKLYKDNNINPAAGCLPYIVQLVVLIALYRVLIDFFQNGQLNGVSVNLNFLWMNLGQPDSTYVTPIIAGVTQFFLALMILPGSETAAEKTLATTTPSKKDDKKAEDMTQMAQTMQQQMVFIMPAMTFFIALKFPSGLALYWIITTLFSLVQQYFISGLGGLTKYAQKIGLVK